MGCAPTKQQLALLEVTSTVHFKIMLQHKTAGSTTSDSRESSAKRRKVSFLAPSQIRILCEHGQTCMVSMTEQNSMMAQVSSPHQQLVEQLLISPQIWAPVFGLLLRRYASCGMSG